MKKLILLVALWVLAFEATTSKLMAQDVQYGTDGTFVVSEVFGSDPLLEMILGNMNGWTMQVVDGSLDHIQDESVFTTLVYGGRIANITFEGPDADLLNSLGQTLTYSQLWLTYYASFAAYRYQLTLSSPDESFVLRVGGTDPFPIGPDYFPEFVSLYGMRPEAVVLSTRTGGGISFTNYMDLLVP